jgi:hypothetical protein
MVKSTNSWRERQKPSLPTLKPKLETKKMKPKQQQMKAWKPICKGVVDMSQG